MGALVELRILEGPNLYFPRAAIKLTLDVSGLAGAADSDVRVLARVIGVHLAACPERRTAGSASAR